MIKTLNKGKSKYHREILPGIWVDVYDVLDAFDVTDPGYQHAVKKLLAVGKRGHKDENEDRKDILDSITRSNERYSIMRNR
jgi:hypothetical protein